MTILVSPHWMHRYRSTQSDYLIIPRDAETTAVDGGSFSGDHRNGSVLAVVNGRLLHEWSIVSLFAVTFNRHACTFPDTIAMHSRSGMILSTTTRRFLQGWPN